MNVVMLLGSGVSVYAGLPSVGEITQRVLTGSNVMATQQLRDLARYFRSIGVVDQERLRQWAAAKPHGWSDLAETERRRSRTYPAVGYTTSPVLKTGWATGPVPLQRGA